MKRPLFLKYVIPFLQWYALMIFLALGIDYLLHRLNLVFVGRHLGTIGTVVILASFVYSLRKRKIILKKSSDSLKERKQALSSSGLNASEIERKLFFDSLTVDMIKKWRVVHLPITLILAVLSLLHIVTILIFSK